MPAIPPSFHGNPLLPALLLAVLLHALLITGVRLAPAQRPQQTPLQVTLRYQPSPPPTTQPVLPAPPNNAAVRHGKPKVVGRVRAEPRHPNAVSAEKSPPPAAVTKIDRALLQQQISDYSSALVKAQEQSAKQAKILPVQAVTTHKYAAAAYEKAWQEKIERVGNLNYPEAARRQNLSGSLLLSVTVDHDGKLRNILVRRSSGHAVLDEAAKHIVQLAAPFAPFPEGLRQEAEMLVITRHWKFFSDSRFSAAP